MKKNLKKPNLLFITILFFSLTPNYNIFAKGFGFWAMPYLGASMGNWENSYTDGIVSSTAAGDTTGLNFGLSTGVRFKKFFFAGANIDYIKHSWRYKDAENYDYDSSFVNTSATQSNYGILGGVKLTKTSIFWIGYQFVNEIVLSENINPRLNAPSYTGKAIKLGMSFYKKRFSWNLFYQIDKLNEMTILDETVELPGTIGQFDYGEYKNKTYILSIGLFLGKFN